mmetsp:Transcript_41225/g.92577  ORF Transcript_41225/g.92577 Transcript_41225/m.92577 type:complete len:209 (+) Transcript_41225:2-628(+)
MHVARRSCVALWPVYGSVHSARVPLTLRMAATAINADGTLQKFPTPEPSTLEAIAAVEGDISKLDALSTEAVNTQDKHGNTLLIWAADRGQLKVVELLLQKQADVNVKGFIGNSAISRAARGGHTDVVRALLSAPGMTSASTANDKMQYPLHFAAFKRHRETVAAMLEFQSVDTTVLDRKGRTPAEDTSDEVIRDMIKEAQKRVTASM